MTIKRTLPLAVAIASAFALTGCGGDGDTKASPTTVTETVTRTVTSTVTISSTPEAYPEPEKPKLASFGGGTHLVGSDIEPGTYRNSSSNGCYWERLSGVSGDMSDLIANEFTDDTTIVTILPTDYAFKSQDCGTWEMVG